MKKVVVASGKGGVGKSMLASSLVMLFAKSVKVVAVDCDVDAPNLHLWLGQREEWDEIEKISVSEKPVIDRKKCTLCGKCAQICAFQALSFTFTPEVEASRNTRNFIRKGNFKVDKDNFAFFTSGVVLNRFFCEGCGACEVVCPVKAIIMKPVKNAEIRVKKIIHGFPLVSAQLYPGETGSGKIVDQIKEKAEQFDYQIMILDSPAGTGCPVIAALNGTDFAILITEPTPSGFSDMKRVLTVVDHFKIPYGVVINKWDINFAESSKIEKWAESRLLAKISYDKRIFKAISELKPILKTTLPVKREIEEIFKKLKKEYKPELQNADRCHCEESRILREDEAISLQSN